MNVQNNDVACNKVPTDHDLLLCALRSASLRARLDANEIDSIEVALSGGMIDEVEAIRWLSGIGLVDQVITESADG